MRQRAAKYSFLAMLINKPNQKDKDQKEINKQLDSLLNPYVISNEVPDTSGWDKLRLRSR